MHLPAYGPQKTHYSMTPTSFKAHLMALGKLYDDLEADYKLTSGEKEKSLLFFNAFSAANCIVFVQKQKEYTRHCS